MRTQTLKNFTGNVWAARIQHGIKRFQPLLYFHVFYIPGCERFLVHKSDCLPILPAAALDKPGWRNLVLRPTH
jgi:hypothetical protein